ncbi:hypothetical protein Leryth_011067 [Lithospermum erythrorhizon]|nr:hypothetical protein Leryth_011067 [Lithospermum erythrorhizon]
MGRRNPSEEGKRKHLLAPLGCLIILLCALEFGLVSLWKGALSDGRGDDVLVWIVPEPMVDKGVWWLQGKGKSWGKGKKVGERRLHLGVEDCFVEELGVLSRPQVSSLEVVHRCLKYSWKVKSCEDYPPSERDGLLFGSALGQIPLTLSVGLSLALGKDWLQQLVIYSSGSGPSRIDEGLLSWLVVAERRRLELNDEVGFEEEVGWIRFIEVWAQLLGYSVDANRVSLSGMLNRPLVNPKGNLAESRRPFLQSEARDGNVSKAHKMLTDSLNWRVQNEIDSI